MSETPTTEPPTSESAVLTLPVLPLTAGVVGPGMVVNIVLETGEARAAAEAAMGGSGRLLLVPRIDGRFAAVGTVAKVEDVGDLPGGRKGLVVRGLERAVIGSGVPGQGSSLWVSAEPVIEGAEPTEDSRALAREYRAVVESVLERRGAGGLVDALRGLHDPGAIADTALYAPDLPLERKVEVLETIDVEARLRLVLAWARETLADLSVREGIDREVVEGLGKAQREAVLRRQLDAIRKELGEADGDVVAEYRRKLDEAGVPDAVRVAVERELDKLERTNGQSPEQGWIITWLDTVFELPWKVRAPEVYDLDAVQRTLDADHAGLD
ncbi:MAG: LON peptidase substrate-binding domain-containing protein, partial [Acidimicrobiia bacterium]|nr:LON peptidase substrate-binding domain-containing protein [Acidimicrobiia bacterium]